MNNWRKSWISESTKNQICNQGFVGSNPATGTNKINELGGILGILIPPLPDPGNDLGNA